MFDQTLCPRVLVIVHAQPEFVAACDPFTLGNICREAQLAKDENLPVLVMEFPDEHRLRMVRAGADAHGRPVPAPRTSVEFSRTQPCIIKMLKGYPLLEVRHTYDGNCGINVVYACADRKIPDRPGYFRVVGVNTSGCVLDTVWGLRALRPDARIEVVQDACNTSNENPKEAWRLSDFPPQPGLPRGFPRDVVLLPGGGTAPPLVAPIARAHR